MNIFYTDHNPEQAARNLDDKRIVKMVVESAQILSNAVWLNGHPGASFYRPAFLHHPVCWWAASCKRNYWWLCSHYESLLTLYQEMYGRRHKCLDYWERIMRNEHLISYRLIPPDMPDIILNSTRFKQQETVFAYKCHLVYKWKYLDKRVPKWTGRPEPEWKSWLWDIIQK